MRLRSALAKAAVPALVLWAAAPASIAEQNAQPPPEVPQPQTPAPITPEVMPLFTAPSTPGRPSIAGALSIEDAVRAAIKNSPSLLSARADEAAASARVDRERALTRPQVSASGIAAANTPKMPALYTSNPPIMPQAILSTPAKTSLGGTAMLMTPLYTSGRLSGAVQEARQSHLSAQQTTAAAQQDLVLAVRTAYRRALLAQAVQSIQADLVRATEERVRVARERYAAGSINLADVLRNQTEYAAALQQMAAATRDAEMALLDLKATIGADLASDVRLADQLAEQPVAATSQEATAAALRDRPEVRRAEFGVRAAEAALKAVRGSYAPQVYLNAMGSATSSAGESMSGVGAAVVVTVPLVTGGQRSAEVREAEAKLASAKQQLESARLQVAREASDAWLAVQAARVAVHASQQALSQAEEDYRIAQMRYETGKAINVEVLDALAALVSARTNYTQALCDQGIAADQLLRAMGRLNPPAQ